MKFSPLSFLIITLTLVIDNSAILAANDEKCSIPTLPGIDISKVKTVKNESSRNQAIEQYIRKEHADAMNYRGYVEYSYNKVDLDGTGNKKYAFVRVTSSFCGRGGCPIDIIKMNGNRYTKLDSFLSYGRLIVVSNKTNGLKDIIQPPQHADYTFFKYQFNEKSYGSASRYATNSGVKGTGYLVCGQSFNLSK
jgi:hypothetical protein